MFLRAEGPWGSGAGDGDFFSLPIDPCDPAAALSLDAAFRFPVSASWPGDGDLDAEADDNVDEGGDDDDDDEGADP